MIIVLQASDKVGPVVSVDRVNLEEAITTGNIDFQIKILNEFKISGIILNYVKIFWKISITILAA